MGYEPRLPVEWYHKVLLKIAVGGDCEDSWRIRGRCDIAHQGAPRAAIARGDGSRSVYDAHSIVDNVGQVSDALCCCARLLFA